jgi:hypothetical protein
MPCYRCGVRQVDPVRGHSPWQRGVRGNQQVLVCPDCQSSPTLTADLDHCRQCGGIRLVRRLGEVECRECGFVVPPGDTAEPGQRESGAQAPGLAEEVALALDRVLGRNSRVPPASATVP